MAGVELEVKTNKLLNSYPITCSEELLLIKNSGKLPISFNGSINPSGKLPISFNESLVPVNENPWQYVENNSGLEFNWVELRPCIVGPGKFAHKKKFSWSTFIANKIVDDIWNVIGDDIN